MSVFSVIKFSIFTSIKTLRMTYLEKNILESNIKLVQKINLKNYAT